MHLRSSAAAALTLSLISALPCLPQDDKEAVFTADTRLVLLPAVVQDKNGHLVTNLTKGQFQVFDDGVPQEIKLFKREDVPVSLGMIIDSSGSMRDKRARVESAALTLVKDSNPQDEVFVVNFNDEAFLDMDFTNDIKKMEQGLSKIDSRGGTAMRDAIRMSIDHLKEKAKKDKRVLLVVTDGDDNASMISLENLVRESQSSDVVIYAIGLLSEEERREAKRAKRALMALTEATGGMVFFPREVNEVESIAHQVAHDIRNQYTIGYTPEDKNLDGAYHTIKVIANAPNHPVVRTRTGYYATRENLSAPKAVTKSD